MISIKSDYEISLMKKAGNIVYKTHKYLEPFLKDGITTKEIDKLAHDFIIKEGATPSFLNYNGFPGTICTSINDEVVHGIPSNRKIKNGDIVKLDIGACWKGYHGDSAWSYAIGDVSDDIKYWYRCETRFRNERAKTLVECFVLNDNYMNVINEVLYNYLDFKDYNVTESNKSRWITSKWWLDFLETNKKLSLKVNLKESSITRKKMWLDKSVSKSELLVYLSNLSLNNDYTLDKYSINYLVDILKEGSKNITSRDISLINEYRIKCGYQPLSDKDLIDLLSNLMRLSLN